jgi:hypothetical protein
MRVSGIMGGGPTALARMSDGPDLGSVVGGFALFARTVWGLPLGAPWGAADYGSRLQNSLR